MNGAIIRKVLRTWVGDDEWEREMSDAFSLVRGFSSSLWLEIAENALTHSMSMASTNTCCGRRPVPPAGLQRGSRRSHPSLE